MTTAPVLTAEQQERGDRINELTDFQRRMLLHYLAGYAPEVVDSALAEIRGQAIR